MRWFLSRTAALVQPPFHDSRSNEGGKLCMIQVSRSLHCDSRRCSSVDKVPGTTATRTTSTVTTTRTSRRSAA
ncbi:unnamed protein product [Xylocopa violacea]|uniref:Uncharacterized protein n=1 Tax=Xylocopa violacea TaxID=135666 RepID=A0ABP1P385_XYLVO